MAESAPKLPPERTTLAVYVGRILMLERFDRGWSRKKTLREARLPNHSVSPQHFERSDAWLFNVEMGRCGSVGDVEQVCRVYGRSLADVLVEAYEQRARHEIELAERARKR